jgi:uncharacterized protein
MSYISMMILPRKLQGVIAESLKRFPVVGLIGPRQVGKTTLAKAIQATFAPAVERLDLELPSDVDKLQNAELHLRERAASLVILDEIQRMPDLFPLLRALVDEDRRNGRFLILGSSSPDLRRQSSESLAGRIIYHELGPFGLDEVPPAQDAAAKLWTRGGYPRSFLAPSDDESFQWREVFIGTHLERDVPTLGYRTPAPALRRFWQMLANAHGQLWNGNKIAGSLGVDNKTVQRYLDILEHTFMVRRLPPFHANVKKRVVKSPKVYLRDSGLLHTLLRIATYDDLLGHPIAGASWEGWVLEQVLAAVPQSWSAFFYRTQVGAEIDLLLQPSRGQALVALEIKRSLTPAPARGFWSALEDLGQPRAFVVFPGKESYPLGQGVLALPVTQLHRIAET